MSFTESLSTKHLFLSFADDYCTIDLYALQPTLPTLVRTDSRLWYRPVLLETLVKLGLT